MMLHSDHRASRCLVYVILVIAGAASFTTLNVSFYHSIELRVLGGFLMVGAGIALTGHVKKNNSIESLGSPLLVAAMGSLSLSAFIPHDGDPSRWVVGLLLAAFACSLHSRYRDLQSLIALRNHMEGMRVNG